MGYGLLIHYGGCMPIEPGYGYSDITNDDKSLKIFPVCPVDTIPTPQVKYFCSVFESSADYLKQFSTTTKANVPVTQTVNLLAALKYSKEQQRQQENVVYIITITAIERTVRLRLPDGIQNDPTVLQARDELKANKYDFYQKYGNAFFSELTKGNEVTIVITFKQVSEGVKSQLDTELGVNVSGMFNISNAEKLNKLIRDNHLSYEIRINTEGFLPVQLPSMAANITSLKKWIDEFTAKFNNHPTTESAHVIKYQTTSYIEIFGEDARPLLDKQLLANVYNNAVEKCKKALAYYAVYLDKISRDTEERAKRAELALKEQELELIVDQLAISQDYSDPEVLAALTSLREIILYLNAIQLAPRRYEFESSKLDVDTSCGCMTYRYTSLPFKLKLPEPLMCESLGLTVVTEENKLPGKLSFLYSEHPLVPYDTLCSSSSVPLIKDLPPAVVEIVELPEEVKPQLTYFAFHFESSSKLDPEQGPGKFKVISSVKYKSVAPILPIELPKPRRVSLG